MLKHISARAALSTVLFIATGILGTEWTVAAVTSIRLAAVPALTSVTHSNPVDPAAASAKLSGRAYDWLLHQQSPSGLLGNQEGDDYSVVYANALAALCFLHQGDVPSAERVFRAFRDHFDEEFAAGTPGGFHQGWSVRTGKAAASTDRWEADNAWLLIALNCCRKMTGRPDFDGMREGVAAWLMKLQDSDGGILAGFHGDGTPMKFKSTEGNLDSYAALVDYPGPRARILEWLKSRMWVPDQHRFRMGSTTDETALDGISWGICALGPEFAGELDYARSHFSRKLYAERIGAVVEGFADFQRKNRIWFEGTGQIAVAMEVASCDLEAGRCISELEKVLAAPGSKGIPAFSNDADWPGAATKPFVASHAWYLFAKWRYNPMRTSDTFPN